MNREWILWGNDLNDITAASQSKNMAWMLIRNECAQRKQQIPMFNEVNEIRKLSDDEATYLKSRKK
jgi:hypothetical protein